MYNQINKNYQINICKVGGLKMSKVVVSYFSASGVTKGVAEKIANAIGGDLFEIEPKEKYTDSDLDWTNKQSRSSIEMTNNIKPEIVKKIPNISDYDTIIIGFPIWWYKEPTLIDKFIEENDLTEKKIYVFVISGSSTIDSTYKSIKNNFPNLNFINGKRFSTDISNQEIQKFINQ